MQRWIALIILALPVAARGDAYPTTEIVKFAVTCMAENGGQTEENLYTCACRFDSISSKLTFDEYDAAVTYERNRDIPGKKGGVFRDPAEAGVLRDKLKKVREEAAAQCPRVVRVERPPSTRQE